MNEIDADAKDVGPQKELKSAQEAMKQTAEEKVKTESNPNPSDFSRVLRAAARSFGIQTSYLF